MKEALSKLRREGSLKALRVFALTCARAAGTRAPDLECAQYLVEELLKGRIGIADLLLFQQRLESSRAKLKASCDEHKQQYDVAYALCQPSAYDAALGVYEAVQKQKASIVIAEDQVAPRGNTASLREKLKERLMELSKEYVGPLCPLLPVSRKEALMSATRWMATHKNRSETTGAVMKHFEIGPCYLGGYIDRELCWAIRIEQVVPNILRSSRFVVIDGITSEYRGITHADNEG